MLHKEDHVRTRYCDDDYERGMISGALVPPHARSLCCAELQSLRIASTPEKVVAEARIADSVSVA